MLIGNSFFALAAVVPASATALETTSALDLAPGVDGDGAGPVAVAAAVLRQPTAYGARESAPSPHKNADLGALALKQRQLSRCPESCPPDSVGFCYGVPIGSESCGVDCCVGVDACGDFSGCVKRDGSCFGDHACFYAKIFLVDNSCKGDRSCRKCRYVDYGDGQSITDSCNGQGACDYLAYEGSVGKITQSCTGIDACAYLAWDGDVGGTITQSCNGYEACKYVVYEDVGYIDAITDSCNGERACKSLSYYGAVGTVTQSCNGLEACKDVAFYGAVGPMTKSCNRDKACTELAKEGIIASITKTCNNDRHKPCVLVDLSHGTFGHMVNFVHAESLERHTRDSIESISDCMVACQYDEECKGIKWKEHTCRPCWRFGGAISDYPCNGRNVCITV